MKFAAQLFAATAALAVVVTAAIHPEMGVLPSNPLAALGLFLIGLGLMRNAQQSAAPAAVSAD